MPAIERVEIMMVDLAPKVVRTDAIQAFTSQETPIVRITDSDGAVGAGYCYTIGTGGSSIVRLLHDHLAPELIGRDADMVEDIWKTLLFKTHATSVGAITSLALAAVDTALWDLRCRRAGLPLYVMAGGAQEMVPVYSTEGGWLQLAESELVEEAIAAKERGFKGCKVKIGKPTGQEDARRIKAVRDAVGPDFEVMTDANQALTVDEAIRRARLLEPYDVAWFEEPMPAEDLNGHVRLARSTSLPIAVGESIYALSHVREYLQQGGCSIMQAECGRIGGITPWLKAAHVTEAFNMPICPHFLMELHVSLAAAVPNGRWVEYIPQLDDLTLRQVTIQDGYAIPPEEPGIGIDWDWEAVGARCVNELTMLVE